MLFSLYAFPTYALTEAGHPMANNRLSCNCTLYHNVFTLEGKIKDTFTFMGRKKQVIMVDFRSWYLSRTEN